MTDKYERYSQVVKAIHEEIEKAVKNLGPDIVLAGFIEGDGDMDDKNMTYGVHIQFKAKMETT